MGKYLCYLGYTNFFQCNDGIIQQCDDTHSKYTSYVNYTDEQQRISLWMYIFNIFTNV